MAETWLDELERTIRTQGGARVRITGGHQHWKLAGARITLPANGRRASGNDQQFYSAHVRRVLRGLGLEVHA